MSISVIKRLISILNSNEDNRVGDEALVIAGNPVKQIHPIEIVENLTDDEKKLVNSLQRMKICGNSMAPCGICNGDVVYVEKKSISDKIRRDSFIILLVDKSKYREPVSFKYKLRRYLMNISSDMSLEEIVDDLKKFHTHILSPEYQKRLQDKIDDGKREYPDEKNFCLSITFKNGSLRYSVHPRNLIEGSVKFVVNVRKNNNFLKAEEIEAY